MYIPEFVVGILATLAFEIGLVIVIAITMNRKGK